VDRGGRSILIIVVVIVVLAIIAWALGLFSLNTQGDLKTPEVSVTGGEVPSVDVDTANVEVGTEETTVELPTVDVEPAPNTPPANDTTDDNQ
jgi:hypothetical protein